mgnify:CR=1 FL=1
MSTECKPGCIEVKDLNGDTILIKASRFNPEIHKPLTEKKEKKCPKKVELCEEKQVKKEKKPVKKSKKEELIVDVELEKKPKKAKKTK